MSSPAELENSQIVHPSYLEKHKSKKDLIRRLRKLVDVLEEAAQDELAAEDALTDLPGLAAVSALLVAEYVSHKDKDARLLAVMGCLEIFAIYAPDSPWDEDEVLDIFGALVRQLGNIGHTTSPDQPYYKQYLHMLEMLASVRIGIVLIELMRSSTDDSEEGVGARAFETLIELVRTLIGSVRAEHPPEIMSLVQQTIVELIDNYPDLPIPFLDELLLPLREGPVVLVSKMARQPPPASKKKEKNASTSQATLVQVEQSNPSYVLVSAVLRNQVNKLATPVSSLLNGLLTSDQLTVQESSIGTEEHTGGGSDVAAIVFEMSKFVPSMLTTVIGTIAIGLSVPDAEPRLTTTLLLGKIFSTSPSLAVEYGPCFRPWLARAKDVDMKIRKSLVQPCLQLSLMDSTNHVPVALDFDSVRQEAVKTVVQLVTTDQSTDVRQVTLHAVCDALFHLTNLPALGYPDVYTQLLQAIGERISAKHKDERLAALKGLAHIYAKHCLRPRLQAIQAGGDKCDLSLIQQAIHEHASVPAARGTSRRRQSSGEMEVEDDEDPRFGWVPRKFFEAAFFTDSTDPDFRSQLIYIIDDLLLGSDRSRSPSQPWSGTARAVGLAMMVSRLVHDPTATAAYRNLEQLMGIRAQLQARLSEYIDARTRMRQAESGTEEALAADTNARQLLESAAALTAPPGSRATVGDIVEAVHGARDRKIFQILGTITVPTHASTTRKKAVDELQKRTSNLGQVQEGVVSDWMKNLVRRCAMGHFINAEVVHHCVLLAQECLNEGDVTACAAFLDPVRIALEFFPTLAGRQPETWETLVELFLECRRTDDKETKRELEEHRVVNTLTRILSKAAAAYKPLQADPAFDADELRVQLLHLCTRDGSPEQARYAASTMASLASQSNDGSPSRKEPLSSLLQALTSPSRLKLGSPHVVSILSALTALSDCEPRLFLSKGGRGEKALHFCLVSVLMGSSSVGEDEGTSDSDVEMPTKKASSGSKRGKGPSSTKKDARVHSTPDGTVSFAENEELSLSCKQLCAAIEFLVTLERSSIFRGTPGQASGLPAEKRKNVFQILTQILNDGGVPPSNRDRKSCKSRQDRAALRQCAATSLLRLCDVRLGLEKKFLTTSMWHVLGQTFLDDERVVREAVMEELYCLLRGSGMYGPIQLGARTIQKMAPPLRFVSLVTLCTDGDNGADHNSANGNAANVGRLSHVTREAAAQCIVNLRRTSEAAKIQCRALGKESEERFEKQFKMVLMPEYMVPYAFHLLSHRRETPFEADDADDPVDKNDSQQRVLAKRLNMLFKPLVESLGDRADNIGFLLRMSEILGRYYGPCGLVLTETSPSLFASPPSSSEKPQSVSAKDITLEKKLKTVCAVAREVLLALVKKDFNLTPYPGTIQVPNVLFKRIPGTNVSKAKKRAVDMPILSKRTEASNTSRLLDPEEQPELLSLQRSAGTSRVHFSPDVKVNRLRSQDTVSSSEKASFGAFSPIPKSSPSSVPTSSSRRSMSSSAPGTLGTSPPSALRDGTLHSTADGSTDQESDSAVDLVRQDHASESDQFGEVLGTDEAKTSSETQSTRSQSSAVSSPRSSKGGKRKAPFADAVAKRSKSRRSHVPSQISVDHKKPDSSSSRSKKQDDLELHLDSENQSATVRNRSSRRDIDSKEQTKPSAKGKKTAAKHQSEPTTRTSRRSVRSTRSLRL